jgi:hypothetical protein
MFPLLQKPFRSEFLSGVFFIALSYIPTFLSKRDYGFWGSLLFGASYYIGGIFIANYIVSKLAGKSIINEVFNSTEARWSFVRLGLLGAIPFSLAVSTFGGLWYFPHWSAPDYYLLGYVLLGWVFYFFFLTVCYIAFKLLLDRFIPQRNIVKGYFSFERKSYKALGVVGGWIAVMVITVALQDSRWLTNFHVQVNKQQTPYLYWYWWLIAVLAWIMLCEFVEYQRKRSSLLKDTLHSYFTPLIAVMLCGITLAITNEVQNLPIDLWHYANFPWTGFAIYKIPAFVVLAWPIQILAFIEFWRAFGDEHTTRILFANSSVLDNKRPKTTRHKRK